MDTKRIIWTTDINVEDWRDDIKEWHPEAETEDEIYELAYIENMENLECEKENLNKPLENNLVIIATLGLWNGVRKGWKVLDGSNLNDIFSGTCGDYVTWYTDNNGDICCDDTHHDGTNHYVYRMIKSGLSKWEFEEAMAEGKPIDELTEKLGHFVDEIYGEMILP